MSLSGIENKAMQSHTFNRVVLFLIFFLVTSTESETGFEDPMMRLNTGLHDEPELDPSTNFSKKSLPSIRTEMSPNVVGVLGKEVRLACYLNNLGNKTISWMRHRDLHLLTVGRYTYTSDQRFSAHHVPLTHYWQLRINNVTYEDAGRYECQISTTPPTGHQIDLRVVEPHTEILGGADMHVDWGSTINLTCVSKFSPVPPLDVIWYHNDKEIGFDSPRGGVSVVIEKGIDKTNSHLLIQRATIKDSGTYRCSPINTVEAEIKIHVLKGKNPDAWLTNETIKIHHSSKLLILFSAIISLICSLSRIT